MLTNFSMNLKEIKPSSLSSPSGFFRVSGNPFLSTTQEIIHKIEKKDLLATKILQKPNKSMTLYRITGMVELGRDVISYLKVASNVVASETIDSHNL